MTWSDHVPTPRRCTTFPPALSAHCDAPDGAGRPVTAVALVPTLAGFLQQRRIVEHEARPVTAAHPPPFPPAFAPDACAGARVHLPERLPDLPLDASSLAWRVVAVGISYCTSFASLRRTAPLRTRRGTRNSANVRACPACVSSTDAGTPSASPRLPTTTIAWISSPPQGGSQIGRRQRPPQD